MIYTNTYTVEQHSHTNTTNANILLGKSERMNDFILFLSVFCWLSGKHNSVSVRNYNYTMLPFFIMNVLLLFLYSKSIIAGTKC